MANLKRILVVLSDNDRSKAALDHAQSLAAANKSTMTAVDVNSNLDAYTNALADIMDEDELRSLVLNHRKKQLQQLLSEHATIDTQTAEAKVLDGVPFIELIREVLRQQHDLIVKVAEGDIGPKESVFGSTDMHLMRKSPVPVWIINPAITTPPKQVLAAIDLSTSSEESIAFNRRILDLAQSVAQVSGAKLHLLSAWHLVGEETMRHSPFLKIEARRVDEMLVNAEERVVRHQKELLRWFAQSHPDASPPHCHVVKGVAREIIPVFVDETHIDLAVMGTIGRTGIPGLLIGNTAESVLSEVNCSVLTVKPKGFLTPVTDDQ